MRDQCGKDVRESLEPVFEKARRIRSWRGTLCGILQGLPNIQKHHPVDIGVDLVEIHLLLQKVADKIDDRLPHAMCLRCNGEDRSCDCEGKGWLSKSQMINWNVKRRKPPISEPDTSQTESSPESSA